MAKNKTLSRVQRHRRIRGVLLEWAAAGVSQALPLKELILRYEKRCQSLGLAPLRLPVWLTPDEWLSDCVAFHSAMDPFSPLCSLVSSPSDMAQLKMTDDSYRADGTPLEKPFPLRIVLDRVRNAYNVGAIMSIADHCQVAEVVHNLAGFEATHKQCRKGAGRAWDRVHLRYEADLKSFLQKLSGQVVVIEKHPRAISLFHWQPVHHCTLVVGNESVGVAEELLELADAIISLPTAGYKNSFNVATALSIAAYHYLMSRRAFFSNDREISHRLL